MVFKQIKYFVLLGLCAVFTARAVDVNVGTQFQLEATRGIGEKMAERIVAERSANGAFKSWDDFSARVKGVGEKKLLIMQNDGLTLATSEAKLKVANSSAAKPLQQTQSRTSSK